MNHHLGNDWWLKLRNLVNSLLRRDYDIASSYHRRSQGGQRGHIPPNV